MLGTSMVRLGPVPKPWILKGRVAAQPRVISSYQRLLDIAEIQHLEGFYRPSKAENIFICLQQLAEPRAVTCFFLNMADFDVSKTAQI